MKQTQQEIYLAGFVYIVQESALGKSRFGRKFTICLSGICSFLFQCHFCAVTSSEKYNRYHSLFFSLATPTQLGIKQSPRLFDLFPHFRLWSNGDKKRKTDLGPFFFF